MRYKVGNFVITGSVVHVLVAEISSDVFRLLSDTGYMQSCRAAILAKNTKLLSLTEGRKRFNNNLVKPLKNGNLIKYKRYYFNPVASAFNE